MCFLNFLCFFQFNGGNIEMRTVQSDSNNISLFSFHLLLNIMQRCRTIKLSDYRAVGLSIHTEENGGKVANGVFGVAFRTKWRISVSFRGSICYSGVGRLTPIDGNLNTEKYMSRFWIAIYGKMLPETLEMSLGFFQDDNCPCRKKLEKTKIIFHVWAGHHNPQI